ncbi:GNAT family N-acetyltransferase [Litoreibacter halocynthiae]|uniref:GNAT family N-acetyltransferase n=1 Tax=Litoreibacter halocynthiae TaxID=1242689 RepID=UPI002490FE9B|nr:GNAT family N-acetyltransferase [Litoreibacter halocynthiae]
MGPRRLPNSLPRDLTLRPFAKGDGAASFDVFVDAVRNGAKEHYTTEQRAAWAPVDTMPATWEDRHLAATAFVAESERQLEGFMTLTAEGVIDMAFVRPSAMGTGITAQLYEKTEEAAHASGLTRLTTEASHLARPFFLRRGWNLLGAQTVQKRGQTLENFRMEKHLSSS